MSETIGSILPVAVGVAISPIPIIAVILMLFTTRAKVNSLAFLVGWIAGILISGGIVLGIANASSLASTDDEPSTTVGVIKLLFGLLLLLLAGRNWRGRPRAGEEPQTPGWMAAIDSFSAVKSLGLAVLLSGINPKNLALTISAAVAISSAGLSTSEEVTVLLVYVVIASITVALPVLYYLILGDRAEATLDTMKEWLIENNATVMAVLLLILGAKLIGDGIAILGA